MYGFSIVPDNAGIVLIVAGIIIGIIFALYEMRIPAPVLNMRLLTSRTGSLPSRILLHSSTTAPPTP